MADAPDAASPPPPPAERPTEPDQSGPSLMRIGVWTVAVLILLGLAIGLFTYFESRGRRPAPAAGGGGAGGAGGGPGGAAAVPVTVYIVEPQSVPLAPTFLGRTEASLSVDIRTRVAGFIDERTFVEGSLVQSGQVLFRLDRRPFEAARDVAQAQVVSAQARLERAQRQVERLSTITTPGAVSETALDEALTDERVAAAELQLSRARLVQAELDLSYTTINSPLTGKIGLAARDVGSYVEPGGQTSLLATVQQVDPIYFLYTISEQDLITWQRLLATGEVTAPSLDQLPLQIQLITGEPYPYEGVLNFLSGQVEPETGTAPARGVVPNPDDTLRPGQFVRVTPKGIVRRDTLLVPQQAVIQSVTGASVYVAAEDDTAQARTVTLGEWQGNGWVIRSGLEEGDRVIVDRLVQLRPGQRITVAATLPPESVAPSSSSLPVVPPPQSGAGRAGAGAPPSSPPSPPPAPPTGRGG